MQGGDLLQVHSAAEERGGSADPRRAGRHDSGSGWGFVHEQLESFPVSASEW